MPTDSREVSLGIPAKPEYLVLVRLALSAVCRLTPLGPDEVADLKLAGGYAWLIPSTEPEKTWREAAPHVLYQLNMYAAWAAKVGWQQPWQNMPGDMIRDIDHLRQLGLFIVTDVDTCIKKIREYAAEAPLTHYYSWTLPPGLPTSWVQPHLELFASKVIPAFR